MGKVRISALPDGGKLQNNEVLVGNRNGITYKFSAWLMPGLNTPYIITAAYADTTVDQNILLLQGGTAQQITVPEPRMFPPQFMNNTAIKIYNQGSNAALLFAQSPTFQWQEYGIVGNIDNPPTYALNSTHIPTLTNASIVANKVVASANSASATTWNYSTGAVTQIIPYTVFTPTVLNIDPSSATGSIKINYTTNNLLQVGSKVLVTDGGVTTEQTIAAGSQSTSPSPLSATQLHTTSYANGKYFTFDSNYLWVSDDFNVWIKTNLNVTTSNPNVTACYFNSKYYTTFLGVVYESLDAINWTSVFTGAFTNNSGVATDGSVLVFACSANNASGINIYSSTDGSTFTSRYTATPSGGGTACRIDTICYSAGKFTLATGYCGAIASADGVSWTRLSDPGGASWVSMSSIIWDGSAYLCNAVNTGATAVPIWRSTDGVSWTQVLNVGVAYFFIYFTTGKYVAIQFGSLTYRTSTDGITWASATMPGSGFLSSCRNPDLTLLKLFREPNNGTNYVSIIAPGYTTFSAGTTSGGYQFTITSPSLPVPDAMYLGGQSLSYSVSTTITPSYTNATLTYVDNAGVITATGAQDIAVGNNVMLKFEGMNSGESMQEIGAALYIRSQEGITLPQNKVMTLTPYKSQYEVDAYYYLIDIADTP